MNLRLLKIDLVLFMSNFNNHFNQYYRQSHRLKGFDYSSNGYYYVTICTKDRFWYFGKIINGAMKYVNLGVIAQRLWREIPKHYPYVFLDEFIVMPNHIHGILIINHGTNNVVAAQNIAPLPPRFASLVLGHDNKFAPQSNNLAAIVRGFKIGVKKYAVINNLDFQWQPRFYDHIIRNQESLDRIREYIKNNPLNWIDDRNNLERQ